MKERIKRCIASLAAIAVLVLCFEKNTLAQQVEAGFGKIRIGGLMQFWYLHDQSATPKSYFRLRRSEIRLSGQIRPEVLWTLMIDPAAVVENVKTEKIEIPQVVTKTVVTDVGRKSVLQDFVITLKPHELISINFGQYKTPFGMEGLESSARLDFVERSALSTLFKWADFRDLGFTLNGNLKIENIKILPTVGVFNGEGQNKFDVNDVFDLYGRLVVKPIEELHLGAAYANSKIGKDKVDNSRVGAELKFSMDPIVAYGEFATGKYKGKDAYTFYLTGGYKIIKPLQLVARFDWYDTDTKKDDNEQYEITGGVNYFIEKHNAKIQLNYVHRGEKPAKDNDIIRINIQVSF